MSRVVSQENLQSAENNLKLESDQDKSAMTSAMNTTYYVYC